MNTNPGLIGKKLGNTQFFDETGNAIQVTAILAGPCVVVGKRTVEKDGYTALMLGMGERREKLVSKAQKSAFEKLGVKTPEIVREVRCDAETAARFDVGASIKPSEIFAEGQRVDVTGITKGRGFTGVMKRWNFRGAGTDTHGTHEYRRHGGSIGTNMTPGRTFPNQKMGGQYGNERVTITCLRIAKVLDDANLLLVQGAVPGAKNGVVTVKHTIKAPPKTNSKN